MDSARTKIIDRLRRADHSRERFRIFAAMSGDAEVIVHSKLMIVDDRLLRIGSANLNNRSMGVDTECDVAIEAGPETPNASDTRMAIRSRRNNLLAEHLGCSAEALDRAIAKHGSLLRAIESLNGLSDRRLAEFSDAHPRLFSQVAHDALTDPDRPKGGWLLAVLALSLTAAVMWWVKVSAEPAASSRRSASSSWRRRKPSRRS